MKTNLTRQEVPSRGVVSFEEEIWKTVVGYSKYEASSLGRIRRINCPSRVLKGSKSKTSKGYYLSVCVADDLGNVSTTGVHRLVCLAFHPLPSDTHAVKYEPNHINGDKLNNQSKNLEWLTHSQNVQHAFDKGFCRAGIRIEAFNIKTGMMRHYNTLSSAARDFGLDRSVFRTILARHREAPYLNQWVFKVDDLSDKKLNRYQAIEVIAKDYVSGLISIYRDSAAAAFATGIRSTTLSRHVSPRSRLKKKHRLLSGYVFKSLSDKEPFPEYSIEDATLSREKYLKGQMKIEVLDLYLNTTKVYRKQDFANEIKKNASAFVYPIKINKPYLGRYRIREV